MHQCHRYILDCTEAEVLVPAPALHLVTLLVFAESDRWCEGAVGVAGSSLLWNKQELRDGITKEQAAGAWDDDY